MAEGTEAWTVLRLIQWTKDYLVRAKVEDPRLCAEILLAHVLACPRMGLYTKFDFQPPPSQMEAFRGLIKRVAAGEPVAYLTGQREFYSLSFKVTPDVLIPRLETELLVDVALQVAKKIAGPAKLWDICTGSGCVAIAAAHYAANLRVLATDVSEKALAVAAENVATHKLADRVTLAQADLLNLPAEADEWGEVHVITANPPYVSESQMKDLPKVVLAEPELALKAGATGLEVIEKIIAQAPPRLAAGGTLAIEMGAGQASAVFELLKAGPFEDIRILKDSAGIERTAVAAKRG